LGYYFTSVGSGILSIVGRIFLDGDKIFFAGDRTFFAGDRVFFAGDRVFLIKKCL